MKTYVFVYGTLKRSYGNNPIINRPGSTFIGEAVTIPDHFTMINGGFPYVLKNGICRIKGELWLVEDPNTMDRLDRLEGVPTHYVRHTTSVALMDENEVIDGVVMYVAAPETERYLRENKHYFPALVIEPDHDGICQWVREVYELSKRTANTTETRKAS